jgi:hypothetical protein
MCDLNFPRGKYHRLSDYATTNQAYRLAHRIRDMQTLPYVVVTNPHISQVYELYYKAFESLRRVREIRDLEDNDKFCKKISQTLQEHLTVIPKLSMGVLECRDLMKPEDMDKFMNTILRSVRLPSLSWKIKLITKAHFPPCNSRTTPSPDRDFLQPLALSILLRTLSRIV